MINDMAKEDYTLPIPIHSTVLGTIDKIPGEIPAGILNTTMNLANGMGSVVFGINNVVNTGKASLAKGTEKLANVTGNKELEEKMKNLYDKTVAEGSYINSSGSVISGGNQGIDNKVIKELGNAGNVIGNQLMSFGVGEAAGVAGSTIQALGVGGSSSQEVLDENPDNIVQAVATGIAKGYASKKIEDIFDSNILTKGTEKTSVQNQITKWISKTYKSKMGKEISNRVANIIAEDVEEVIEDNVDYIIDKIINNKDLPSLKELWDNEKATVKTTTISTAIMQLFGLGGDSFANKETELNSNTKFWANETQKIIDTNNLTEMLNDNILDILTNNLYENTQNSTSDLQQNTTNNQQNTQEQQITPSEIKTSQNQNMEQIETLPTASSSYDISARQNNIDLNNETVKAIKQVTEQRGIKASYNADVFSDSSINAVWKSSVDENGNTTREVILNPNTTDTNKTLENIITHELTHDLEGTNEYNELKSLLLDYNNSKVDYQTARTELENLYSKVYNKNSTEFQTLIDNEVVADILGNKLGDQDFINNLTTEKPTVSKKIYNWVVDKLNKLNKLTGYKNEKIFWQDVKNKFEVAYSQDYQGSNSDNTLYSIAGKKAMHNLIKNDAQNNIVLEQLYNKAQQMQKFGVDNETIRQQTNWFQDKNGDWKFEFSDKDMTIKSNIQLKENTTYRLGDILEHDTLFMAYPELQGYEVKFRNLKSEGAFNANKDIISLNNNKLNNKNRNKSIESTLVHEIQHAIQNIEEFEHGKSSKNSKLAYYNSLGEIEATDTKDRFLQEKYDNNDMSNVPPESSKSNPQHKALNNYLENRNLLDKVKDSVYNYFNKKGGENYEISEETLVYNNRKNRNMVVERRYIDSKKIGSNSLSQASNSQKSSAIVDSPSSLPTNSITSQNPNVNTTNQYSIQESKNNAWQKFLDANYKGTGKGQTMQEVKTTSKNTAPTAQNNILSKANENTSTAPELIDTKQYIAEKRTKEKANLTEIKDTLAQKTINKGHYIDKLAKETNNPQLTYKYDRTMNAFNEAQVCIGENQVDMNGKIVGESLNDIFKEAENSKLSKEFDDYLLNKHNIARNPVGKGIYGDNVTAPQSSQKVAEYEAKYPQFKEWSEKVNKYNDNSLKDLVNANMITEETYNHLRELYGDYVPTFRDITETKQEFDDRVGNNPLKKATKSDKKILSPKEAMAEQTIAIKKAIRINEIGKELYKTIGKDSTFIDGINFDTLAIETLNSSDIISKLTDGDNIFTIFEGEKMIQFKISDELYSAFSKDTLQNKIDNSKVAKALLTPIEKASKVHRDLVTTYSIGFAMNNPIKDFGNAIFNTKYSTARFVKNYAKALYNIATDGDWYQSYKNNGGGANTYFDYDKGVLKTKKNLLQKFASNIRYVNEVFEQVPRVAEYISTIEVGLKNDGIVKKDIRKNISNINQELTNEALYNSAEITTNFKRGGDITKVANKYGGEFLNASVQGLDKFYRNITGQHGFKGYAHLLVKATLYEVAPAILNHLLLRDDDDYERLPEYTKDNYYLFKLNENGDFLRIPKDRVSSVIGGIARRVVQTVQGDKEVDWSSIVDTAINQLAPNNPLTDNIVAPIKQAIDNETWYGGDIVSSRLQKLPEAEQYDESTDKFSIWLGEKLNISPKKINYVLDQYSGGIGDVVLPMLTPQAENNILTDKFTTNATMKNKNVSKYYTELYEAEKRKNSSNATEEDELKYKYLYSANQDLSDLYKEKRDIQMSETLSDKEKKEQVMEIQKKINNIAEEKLKGVEKIKIDGSSATIDGEEYYNDGENWTKLTEEESSKNKDISITTYSDYKSKVKTETEKQRKAGTLKESQSLKDKDKIEILLNSNYSDKEKQSLYENYILDSSDKKYAIIKESFTENGLNIDKYLEYKQQEFEADKTDDGTVNGKSISGSKKQKVYNYIYSIKDASYTQKTILYALEYEPSSASDKNIVINFVENLPNKTAEERLEVLSKFAGVTVYKNGRFEY